MIEVVSIPGKGRGLSTSEAVLQGSVLLSSSPFVYVLSKTQRGLRCDHCLKRHEALLRCSGCKFMKYCNRRCQKGAWHWHKPECAALKRVSPKLPPDFVILLSRVLWKLEKAMDDNKTDDLVSIVDLESNYSRLTEAQKESLGQFVIILHSYWGQGTLPLQVPDIKAVLELCAKLKNNSFAIADEESQADIGTGVYLSCSLLNHSCRPNCVVEFEHEKIKVRALRNIKPGEELLISYVDLFAPSDDRQKELMDIYRFSCTCPACVNKLNDDKMLQDYDGKITPSKREAVSDLLHELNELKKAGALTQILKIVSDYILRKVLPLKNVYVAKALDFAMDAAIELQDFDKAFEYGILALDAYKEYLDEFHPISGLQMMKLGKILLYLMRHTDALRLLLKSLKVLKVTHSNESVVRQQLDELLAQCQCELRHQKKE